MSGAVFKKTTAQMEAVKLLTREESSHTLLFGGSRSGKTFIIIRQIILRAINEPGSRHCCLRKFTVDINKSIINDTFPAVMEKCFPQVPYRLNRQLFYAEIGDSQIWFGGLDNGDKILGNEYATMYFNECSELSYNQIETAYSRNAQKCKKLKNRFYYDENPVGKSHWSYKLFVQGLNPVDNSPVVNPSDYCSMRMNPIDNLENLSATYMQTLDGMSAKKRARFRDGEWQDDNENALWKRETMISPYRVRSYPMLDRVVVAVDPAVTAREDSDETGIIIAGCAKNPKTSEMEYYVLEDRSMKGTPNEWAQEAIALYDDYDADRLVAEVNNGGDLVSTVLYRIDPNLSYKAVHAKRGKILRAEPISALYERGLVHHVGTFPLLEDEMCNYTGRADEDSPDRLDALVWALTELSSHAMTKVEYGHTAFSY